MKNYDPNPLPLFANKIKMKKFNWWKEDLGDIKIYYLRFFLWSFSLSVKRIKSYSDIIVIKMKK